MTDRDVSLARLVQQIAESGDYEGFNAIVGVLMKDKEFNAKAIEVLISDGEFRKRIADICHNPWERKHA